MAGLRVRSTLLALATSAVGALSSMALAQPASKTEVDRWVIELALYGYFPKVDGRTEFPSNVPGSTFGVGADTLIDDLKFGFMGALVARRGAWGGLVDVFYADVGDGVSASRQLTIAGRPVPAGVDATLSLDMKTTILTLAGSYAAVTTPDLHFDLLAGARLLDQKQTLGWTLVGQLPLGISIARSGTTKIDDQWWDAVVGISGRVRLGDEGRWLMPFYIDAGAGDSRLTWQAVLGVSHSFSWGSVIASWRHIDYDFKAGQLIESLGFSGPAVGVAFRF